MKSLIVLVLCLMTSVAMAGVEWTPTSHKSVFVSWIVRGSCARVKFQNRSNAKAVFTWKVSARLNRGKPIVLTPSMHEVLKPNETSHVYESCGTVSGPEYIYELEVR